VDNSPQKDNLILNIEKIWAKVIHTARTSGENLLFAVLDTPNIFEFKEDKIYLSPKTAAEFSLLSSRKDFFEKTAGQGVVVILEPKIIACAENHSNELMDIFKDRLQIHS
jgi:hypothetical protein